MAKGAGNDTLEQAHRQTLPISANSGSTMSGRRAALTPLESLNAIQFGIWPSDIALALVLSVSTCLCGNSVSAIFFFHFVQFRVVLPQMPSSVPSILMPQQNATSQPLLATMPLESPTRHNCQHISGQSHRGGETLRCFKRRLKQSLTPRARCPRPQYLNVRSIGQHSTR